MFWVINMLTRFEVQNYKNFKDKIVIDFKSLGEYKFNSDCLYNKVISKLMIYGRNASGKTNLGSALLDASDFYIYRRRDQTFTNADTKNEFAKFKYCFEFGEDIVEYIYEKDENSTFTKEGLYINNNKIYFIDYIKEELIVGDLASVSAETLVVERFNDTLSDYLDDDIGRGRKPSFLRWMAANSALKNDSVIISIVNYLDKMQLITVGSLASNPRIMQTHMFEVYGDEFVRDLEMFFNQMGIECKLILKTLPEGEKKLYFNYSKPVPFFENASSGTIALFNLYRRIILPAREASLIYLDEFDAFYHYELSENILKYLKNNYPKTQIIITTHNTNLMTNRLSRPDCLFILSLDGKLTSLNNATERELREGHNLEKLYISGEFEKYE